MGLMNWMKHLGLIRCTYREWGARDGAVGFPGERQGITVPAYFETRAAEAAPAKAAVPERLKEVKKWLN